MNETGLILREGKTLLEAWVITRDDARALAEYLIQVVRDVEELAARREETRIAVEEVTPPRGYDASGKRAPIDPGSLIITSAVYGSILSCWEDAVVVPPGGNGSGPRITYPPELWGHRERVGTGFRRHLRSAWDVAAAGETLSRRELRLLRSG